MRFLVGIDDTDNLESRGTGHRARQLSGALAEAGFDPLGITRHQLFVDSRIPYTSHNSSACIEVETRDDARNQIVALSRSFLLEDSAPGSDAGLCVTTVDAVAEGITAFGTRAKREVVEVAEATGLAASIGAHLEGLTGTGIGVIGALAAVGLRAGANDGRFLWLPRLREITGVYTTTALLQEIAVDVVETEDGRKPGDDARIAVGDWPRPLLRHGRRVFLVQEADGEDFQWIGADKQRLKHLSD